MGVGVVRARPQTTAHMQALPELQGFKSEGRWAKVGSVGIEGRGYKDSFPKGRAEK